VLSEVPQAIADGILLASIYAIVALGLTLTFGVLHVVNFSHGQLVTLGAYLVYELTSRGLSILIAVPITMAGLAVVGVLMGELTFRPVRSVPINGLLVSIGWIAIVENVINVIWGPDQYNVTPALAGSVHFLGVSVSKDQLLVLAASIVVMIALSAGLRYTTTGRALRATAQNREAAALVGIRTRRLDAGVFAIGTGLAGLAGGALANLFPVVPGTGNSYMVFAFVALIVGGAGSALGAVVGSLLVGLAISVTQTFGSTAVANVVPFLVLIVVLFFRPLGIFRTGYESSL
jgi:branched-chain amino acid transport system permease protein